jgi:hypothetical protein
LCPADDLVADFGGNDEWADIPFEVRVVRFVQPIDDALDDLFIVG